MHIYFLLAVSFCFQEQLVNRCHGYWFMHCLEVDDSYFKPKLISFAKKPSLSRSHMLDFIPELLVLA